MAGNRRLGRVAGLLAAALLLAACGSTVRDAGPVATGSAPLDGVVGGAPGSPGTARPPTPGSAVEALAGPSGGAATTGRPAGGSPAPAAPAAAGPVAGPSGAGPGQPDPIDDAPIDGPAQQPGAAGAAGASGMGYSADELWIGVVYNSQFEAQAAAAGYATAVGDQRAIAETISEDLNRRGGILGRQVRLVFYDTQGREWQDASTVGQAACVRFTEDQPVFAAMTSVSQISNDNFFTCLTERGVVAIGGVLGLGVDTRDHLQQFAPHLYLPAGAPLEGMAETWMRRLDANGYLTGWDPVRAQELATDPVVGLLYGSNGDTTGPLADALLASVERELAAIGHRLAVAIETTGAPNEHPQAVLRFRDAGVTHVIGDAALIQFLPAAAAQAYRPRYGLATLSNPALVALVAPPGQLTGAVGIGWSPPLDVDDAHDPGDVSPAQARCREMMESAGHDPSQRLAWAVMAYSCDVFNFLHATIEAGGLSPSGVREGAEAIGSLDPVSVFQMTFPGGRAVGAGAARDIGWAEDCRCFAYTSDAEHPM